MAMAGEMTAADALDKITRYACAASNPVLTGDDLADLVGESARADAYGLSITDPAWTPTYNCNYGVYKGWELKYGRLVGTTDFSTQDQKFSRSQIMAQVMAQIKTYKSRCAGSLLTRAPQRSNISPTIIPTPPIIPPTEPGQETL